MNADNSDGVDEITYDEDWGVYRASFDVDAVAPSHAVVCVVATMVDVDPTDLPPLYDAIDPDSLDRLTAGTAASANAGPDVAVAAVQVEFEYAGYSVRVGSTGSIEVRPASGDGSATG